MCRTHDDFFPLPLRSSRWMGPISFAAPLGVPAHRSDSVIVLPNAPSVVEPAVTVAAAQEESLLLAQSYDTGAKIRS
jgi:hypothetical protein